MRRLFLSALLAVLCMVPVHGALAVPGREGPVDVVLGYDTLEEYGI